jgi:hypothetical protein
MKAVQTPNPEGNSSEGRPAIHLRGCFGLCRLSAGLVEAGAAIASGVRQYVGHGNLGSAPRSFHAVEDVKAEVAEWPNVTQGLHRFGGVEFEFCGKEFGHSHSNGLLDIPFSQEAKRELIATGQANPHHLAENSGWVSFRIRGKADKVGALKLLRRAW